MDRALASEAEDLGSNPDESATKVFEKSEIRCVVELCGL